MDETTGSNWESWIQGVAGSVIGKAADNQYSQDYELQRLRLQALGQMGYYQEGQPGAVRQSGAAGGITSGTLLLIGGAVLVFMFMKD